MAGIHKRVSKLEVHLARRADSGRQDRSIVEAIMENRRRMEGLPAGATLPPATLPRPSRQRESIAEAIWRAQAVRRNQAKAEVGQE